MTDAPKMIYLLPFDGEQRSWCNDPDPGGTGHADEADAYIRLDAPELVALATRAQRVIAHYALVHAGNQGGYRTAGQLIIADMKAALAAFDAMKAGR
jgi:hypothetical protein